MSTTRLHPHHSLPAPVVHAGFSVPQSKSNVLAGVQDAYWSDDEAEDADCPLCLEEMDISDLNFKPCICGYQICRFCWHHIKENLNKRCPACRRVYTDDAVEFKPIATQDHKRLTQQKKQRERERKELESLGRRQLANVRVVQRNVVYVVGIGPRFAKEELIPTLRSNEYFGQYGKITKILLVKRTPSGGGAPVVGVYITYHRREDAARAIAAVDGTSSPGGGRDVMRASYGTTKYCMAFLRGVQCSDHGCMNLHEWGDEKDCFTKEDLTTLKHTMKATESRTRTTTVKKGEEQDGLPRAASWAQKGVVSQAPSQSTSSLSHVPITSGLSRQTRRGGAPRQSRSVTASTQLSAAESKTPQVKVAQDQKSSNVATSQPALSSRPSTPVSAIVQLATPVETKTQRNKKESVSSLRPSSSPAPSAIAESDAGSASHEPIPSSPSIPAGSAAQSPLPSTPALPAAPAVPPGLSAPPGIPTPSRPPRVATASPQTPLLASQTSYQMSTAARALLDDVKARRESIVPLTAAFSPFPDLDRTLQTLNSEDGGFSFSLDPKLADEAGSAELPDLEAEANVSFHGSFMDTFPGLRSPPAPVASPFMTPPGLPYPAARPPTLSPLERQAPRAASSYIGSFDPFSDNKEDPSVIPGSPLSRHQYPAADDDRKVSRFGFARGRQGSTATSSPLHAPSPLSNGNSDGAAFFNSSESFHNNASTAQWPLHGRQEYPFAQSSSNVSSPLLQHAQAQGVYAQQPRFQPFDTDVSEAQLRDFIQISRERANGVAEPHPGLYKPSQQFNDPAIMSASFAPQMQGQNYHSLAYGPPPGLSFPQNATMGNIGGGVVAMGDRGSAHASSTTSPAPSIALSTMDFPALAPPIPPIDPTLVTHEQVQTEIDDTDSKAHEKAERKAARKALAAERAAGRQKIAEEKAAAKAAEKAKLAKEKVVEKEKAAAALKLQQEQVAKERAEQQKAEEERLAKKQLVEQEKTTQGEVERAAQVEMEKLLQSKKSSMKQLDIQKGNTVVSPATKPNARPSSKPPGASPVTEPKAQVPLLSKKPKKNKPVTKPIKVPKEEESVHDDGSALPSAAASDAPRLPGHADTSSNNSRSHSPDRGTVTSVEELLEEIDILNPQMDLVNHPFFDIQKLNAAAKMPLEYGPLVHALSALSVGGGSFANNMPSGSIDNAVSSFQQLLETLTQTISDLLRLLPRTTWDDSSSFDGVLREMLKGDDFLDDGGEEGKEDEVAALTLALERRARWMEVQLSKLEELHRDINMAAVRAVLSFNDSGWDRHGFLPRITNTLRRFDSIGLVEQDGVLRSMTADELEKKLAVATEAAVFAETEVREVMEKLQGVKLFDSAL
ncbi:hypothetical protein BDQ12DRAFT_676664 [Crucibulum laeve]|uniref:RING-type domain-containing protein n=1 Tax=Crucibulum laeve TaxID=68775 RepID=A0A5C3ME63_9AGAR|nr:hypothetical protein BDQ12DRAFT_676664 [Crucibulum laeve]